MLNDTHFRGTLASILSTIVSNTINIIYIDRKTKQNENYNSSVSNFIILFIFGNILSYSLDIIFAKKHFNNVVVPYGEYTKRLIFLVKSYFSSQFYKFVLTIILDFIIIDALIKIIKKKLDEYNIHFFYRDGILIGLLSLLTFLTYVNILRFSWAYVDESNPWIDITIYAWLFISVIVYVK